jgi:hypothetical protein
VDTSRSRHFHDGIRLHAPDVVPDDYVRPGGGEELYSCRTNAARTACYECFPAAEIENLVIAHGW